MAVDSEVKRLDEIVATMDVPPARVRDYGWLMRNLAINNSGHPDLQQAIGLAQFMHRVERRMEER